MLHLDRGYTATNNNDRGGAVGERRAMKRSRKQLRQVGQAGLELAVMLVTESKPIAIPD